MRETNSLELAEMMKGYPKFSGVYARDQLPMNECKKNLMYIINMDKSTGGGTHWVIIFNVNPKYCLYIDSFGLAPPKEVEKFMKATDKTCLFSDTDLQADASSSCGWFCVYFLQQLSKGVKPLDLLYDGMSPNTTVNEKHLQQYFKKKSK